VQVGSQLKIDPAFGADTITVKSVDKDEITVTLQGSSRSFQVEGKNVSISSSCTSGRCHDQGELSLSTSRPGRVNKIHLSLVGADNGHAVLVLRPR
jgi:hypothetical protein